MPSKAKSRLVLQLPWAAVKENTANGTGSFALFDVWRWNPYKMKWVRMANTACGYSSIEDARTVAEEVSRETANMLEQNRNPPPPMEK